FPWVRMLGVGYRGFAGEGKIVAAGSLLMSLLLCILTSGRQRPMIQSVAAAWGTLVFVWLMHLSWTLSDDPRLLLRVTFWLPLTSILSLLAGICFAALQFPSRRALLTSIVLLWIAVNFLSWRGQAFRLEAQTRSSLVRPYDRP